MRRDLTEQIEQQQEERDILACFNPLMVYTVRRKTLKALLLDKGSWVMWNGAMYDIKSKHIGAGVYEVTGKLQP